MQPSWLRRSHSMPLCRFPSHAAYYHFMRMLRDSARAKAITHAHQRRISGPSTPSFDIAYRSSVHGPMELPTRVCSRPNRGAYAVHARPAVKLDAVARCNVPTLNIGGVDERHPSCVCPLPPPPLDRLLQPFSFIAILAECPAPSESGSAQQPPPARGLQPSWPRRRA
ncbi:hypothetical protein BS50DRAFT_16004 [Corynespora cassiicola Philippines]|uniref:Uncharacterized protein n=1 Tax=Corynespora cassiicola Philippines TaxID=1448308 RepID=A0A2T2P9W8_CORCC|nr:hypothetical protein BS50DRAFT_16004 [Corynespora cassiicola Philippines]